MAHIEGAILIRRPINEVFDFVADERNEPRYNSRMRSAEKISPGPIGPGTRFRAATGTMRRPAEMTIEITGYERPQRLTSSTQVLAIDINGALTFTAVPEGTRVDWSWDVDTQRCSKVLAPIVARLGERQAQRIWTNLKQVLEGQARPLAPPQPAGRLGGARPKSFAECRFRVHRSGRRWVPRWMRSVAQRGLRCTPRRKRTP